MVISSVGGVVMAKSKTKGDELITVEINLYDIIEAKKTSQYSVTESVWNIQY